MNLQKTLKEASDFLKRNRIKSPKLDSELLMSKILKSNRENIILYPNQRISNRMFSDFKNLLNQRALGKPIAYLVGKKEFWKYEFVINEKVLIPRPDSELVVEKVLELTRYKSRLKILDIGVGSGCILLSILKEKEDFYGTGIDISRKCIDLSKVNANRLDIKERVKFFKSNVDNFNYGKYDLIVSNPPYINSAYLKYLDKSVINFEPKNALNGGIDGISEIRKVINKSSELIKINGKLILEIAFNQKERVSKLLINKGFYINNVVKDYANNNRCIISTKI